MLHGIMYDNFEFFKYYLGVDNYDELEKEYIVSLLIEYNRLNMLKYAYYRDLLEFNVNHGWHALSKNYIKMYNWMIYEKDSNFKKEILQMNNSFKLLYSMQIIQ